jgi:hypothetical protein
MVSMVGTVVDPEREKQLAKRGLATQRKCCENRTLDVPTLEVYFTPPAPRACDGSGSTNTLAYAPRYSRSSPWTYTMFIPTTVVLRVHTHRDEASCFIT